MVGMSEHSWQTTGQKVICPGHALFDSILRGTGRKRYAGRLFWKD